MIVRQRRLRSFAGAKTDCENLFRAATVRERYVSSVENRSPTVAVRFILVHSNTLSKTRGLAWLSSDTVIVVGHEDLKDQALVEVAKG